VRKHLWKVRSVLNPAHTAGERGWFVFYGIASTFYRIFISIRILLFLNDRLPQELFLLVPLFALSAVISWVLVPVGKFVHYLAAASELARTRFRAVGSTVGVVVALILLIGVLKMPDYCRIEGVVEPQDLKVVYAGTDGFVKTILSSGQTVTADRDTPVLEAVNIPLLTEEKTLLAELQLLQARQRIARTEEIAAAQIINEQISALKEQIQRVQYELSTLRLGTDLSGTWISPNYEKMQGVYLRRGDPAGYIAPDDGLLIRATAGQNLAAMLVEQHQGDVQIRPKGRPDIQLTGSLDKIFPAGQEVLPTESLGYAAGGAVLTNPQDPSGRKTAEKFFEVWIIPQADSSQSLLTGQRVIARVKLRSKPLAVQWWLALRQLFQRRFHI
jgi:putative peptide zinc metalloprotease protein